MFPSFISPRSLPASRRALPFLFSIMNPFVTSNGNRCPYCDNQLAVKVSKGCNSIISVYKPPRGRPHIFSPVSAPTNAHKHGASLLDPFNISKRKVLGASVQLWPPRSGLPTLDREQRKKDTNGAPAPAAPLTAPTLLPTPSLPTSSATAPAPRRRRQRLDDYTAVDYPSLEDWVANTLPPIRALEAYQQPLDAHLRHLDDLPGVKSPTPEVESVREMYEREVREDELLLSRARAGPSRSHPHSAPLRLPTSIVHAGSPTRSLSPIDLSLRPLRPLSPSPDFPATVPLPIAAKARAAAKHSTATAPLRITTQLNNDWMNVSPASKTTSLTTFYVKKKARKAHRVFWIEDTPSWPEWSVSEATGAFAKLLGDAEVDHLHPKFKTWAAIRLTFVHAVTSECVIMLRKRDIECHELDATLRIFYPNDNNTIHIRKNLRAERTDVQNLYKSRSKAKRVVQETDSDSDVQIIEVRKCIKREDDDELPYRQQPRRRIDCIDINDTDDDSSTPALTTSSLPSPLQSSSSLPSPLPLSSESPMLRTPVIRWPTGVHVVDMVKGFKLMDSLASTGLSREDRFKRAFNEPYRQSTVTDQRAIYRAATPTEIKRGIDAGWSKEGLWSVWRKSLASA
ncbi:hypothetical protein GGX14DRAFT_608397 [Mycena pura]|uniref:Uncharacterized protein n=1 Tax=Mycena pura TaxID=153505 RepID=A0AAD6VK93_9AGAR|nr:hypothetical protein GGX14DRAFT_608397 [Mycena pura]